MPTRSDDDRVCLPRTSVNNAHRILIEKMSWANSLNKLDTGTTNIFCQVFFLVSIVRYPLSIG